MRPDVSPAELTSSLSSPRTGEEGGWGTCVIEQAGDEGAVSEEGVGGGDVFKVALLKHGVFEDH